MRCDRSHIVVTTSLLVFWRLLKLAGRLSAYLCSQLRLCKNKNRQIYEYETLTENFMRLFCHFDPIDELQRYDAVGV